MKKILIVLFLILILCNSQIYSESKNIFFLYPFYMPETTLGLVFTDILYFKKKEHNCFSSLNSFATYTLKNQFVLGTIPEIYFDNKNYLLEAKLVYMSFLRNFYGIGNNTIKDNEEEFVNRAYDFGISFSRKIIENLMLGVQCDFSDMTMQDIDDKGQLQHIKTNGVISGVGFKVKFDTRDSDIYPTKGFLINTDYLLYNDRFGSKYNYSLTNFDLRNYFYIYGKKLLFSYQLYCNFINGKAPIQVLQGIGGANLLRGFYANRYTDNILLVLQPELKIKITNSVWLALFSGVGNVYNTIEDIDLNKIKVASGLGLRMKIKDNPRLNFRIDFAASNESKGTYFTLMEAF